MECINKIEILGRIGNIRAIPLTENGSCAYKFSAVTEFVHKSKEGAVLVDCTWHTVTAIESFAGEYAWLAKGEGVHVFGWMRNIRYIGSDGGERIVPEIVADKVNPVKE